MLADGNLLSGGLSTRTAAAMFEQVCTLYQGDQTEQEMLFPEFLTMLARLCDMKQTEADRQVRKKCVHGHGHGHGVCVRGPA